jgi:protein-tyrosine phosphatase
MERRILFVCLGNICRSPAAEGVFRSIAERTGLPVIVDSAGTGDWHAGAPPDRRMIAAAARRGVDLSGQRARQVRPADFSDFTHLLAMDRSNLAHLREAMPEGTTAHVGLLLDYLPQATPSEVPDPYHGGRQGFEDALDLIEAACRGLAATLAAGR